MNTTIYIGQHIINMDFETMYSDVLLDFYWISLGLYLLCYIIMFTPYQSLYNNHIT